MIQLYADISPKKEENKIEEKKKKEKKEEKIKKKREKRREEGTKEGPLFPLVEGVMLSVMALLCLRAGPLIPGVLGRCIYWYGLCCPSWLYCCLRETARGMLFVMAVLLFEGDRSGYAVRHGCTFV